MGSGSAHDPERGNVSFLLQSLAKNENKTSLLIDCGFMNVAQYFKQDLGTEILDAVYISHSHADHIMGLIPLISKMNASSRSKKLVIIGHQGLKDKYLRIEQITERDLPNIRKFELEFVESNKILYLNDLRFDFARTSHGSYTNYSVKITQNNISLFYSGDGKLLPESASLMMDSDFIIANTATYSDNTPAHSTIQEILNLAPDIKRLKAIYFTHILPNICRNELRTLININSQLFKIYFPEPLDEFYLDPLI